ncbi:MAG TPA: hypothetical protein VE619_01475 [Nitrososphaeraceae archaeon]|nr:hypothetical protein [Nitrososphaeraceae archaeon]
MDKNLLDSSTSRYEDRKNHFNSNTNNIPAITIYADREGSKAVIKAKDTRTGQILQSGTDVVDIIQRALDALPATTGGVLSISDGYYEVTSNNIIIPNIDNLTIEGSSPSGNTVFDARNIHPINLHDARYVGVFSRSTEDPRNNHSLDIINNLTIRNIRIIGNQTGSGYLADRLAIDGLRINNVNNLFVENVHTNSVGLSIECRNIDGGIIRNCRSFNDAAGPTLSNNTKNIIIENCYTFGSYDDSFACLGNKPTTTAITFKNCIADKGLDAPPSVTASCFKLDSGGAEDGISGVTYINCKAYNSKPGRIDIQGGFINGDPRIRNVKYICCSAINCHVGIKVAGTNMKVMGASFQNCLLQNCDIALVTEVRSPGAQFQDISFVENKQDTAFYTPPMKFKTGR